MATHKLLIDDFDTAEYTLFAIHSSLEDYRLAYFVNRELELSLERCPKDIGFKQKGSVVFFSRYLYEDEDADSAWNLIQNKNSVNVLQDGNLALFAEEGLSLSANAFFLPELKTVDYILKVEDDEAEPALVIGKLLAIKHITTAYKVDHYKLKSKNNLIF